MLANSLQYIFVLKCTFFIIGNSLPLSRQRRDINCTLVPPRQRYSICFPGFKRSNTAILERPKAGNNILQKIFGFSESDEEKPYRTVPLADRILKGTYSQNQYLPAYSAKDYISNENKFSNPDQLTYEQETLLYSILKKLEPKQAVRDMHPEWPTSNDIYSDIFADPNSYYR